MKNILKTVLMTAAAALATSVAQANTDTGVIMNGGVDITVSSTATKSGGLWTYTYNLSSTSATALDGFTVIANGLLTGSPADIGSIVGAPGFAGTVQNDEVSWTTTPTAGVDTDLPLDGFSFTSPIAPMDGVGAGFDGGTWPEISGSVLVPCIPDGGLTASLLGLSFLGLGALRRKLGC